METRFSPHIKDGHQRGQRHPEKYFIFLNISPRVSFGGRYLMMNSGISLETRTELHILERGILTAEKNVNDILQEYVVPFAPFIFNTILLLCNYVRLHTAGVIHQYLKEVGIHILSLSAKKKTKLQFQGTCLGYIKKACQSLSTCSVSFRELTGVLTKEQRTIQLRCHHKDCFIKIGKARGGTTHY